MQTKKPSGRQPRKQPKKNTAQCAAGRAEESSLTTPSPEEANATSGRFDWAAEFVKLKFCKEIKESTEGIESAGNTAVLSVGIDTVLNAEQSLQKRSMLDEHFNQLGKSVSASAKKRCTDLGKLAIPHPDKLGELFPWQWARQQIEAELWGFLKLDTPASRPRRFIRRVCGGLEPAAGLDLWMKDEPAPDEPPPRLPRWLDSHQDRPLAAHFGRPKFEPPAADDDAQLISPKDTEDFFCDKERELKSELENALVDAETDLYVESVRTTALQAKVPETAAAYRSGTRG